MSVWTLEARQMKDVHNSQTTTNVLTEPSCDCATAANKNTAESVQHALCHEILLVDARNGTLDDSQLSGQEDI